MEKDSRRYVAIVETERISDSILNSLIGEGVRSLRVLAGSPIGVRPRGKTSSAPNLDQQLAILKSIKLQRELRKRLQETGVDSGLLKKQWHHNLARIQRVQIAESLITSYQLGKYSYLLDQEAGIDPSTGILWISAQAPNQSLSLYESMKDIVFAADAPVWVADALKRAVEMDYQSRIKMPKGLETDGLPHSDQDASEIDLIEEEANFDEKERIPVHQPTITDESVFPLSQSPLRTHSEIEDIERQSGSAPSSKHPRKDRNQPTRPDRSNVEREEISRLKQDHYAWHCQACLGGSMPSQLSPEGSYSFFPLNRMKHMEAHHVTPVRETESIKGAENIIILCYHHHHSIGDKITTGMIRDHLRENREERTVEFPADPADRSVKKISGVAIEIELDVEPWVVTLFFTMGHAAIWVGGDIPRS